MVTYINKVTSWEHPYMEYRGLSTDTKPADAPVNAKFVELDTGVEYYFSEGTWNIAPSPSGDGSGTGGAEKFVVTLTEDTSGDDPVWTADKTIAEIVAADAANQVVVAKYPVGVGLNIELPLVTAFDVQGVAASGFTGFNRTTSESMSVVTVSLLNQGSGDVIQVVEIPIPTSSNEKFVVTLTESNGAWSADKTIAEIVAAYSADKNVVVHAEQPIDIFCTGAFDTGDMKIVLFGCVTMNGAEPTTYAVLGYENQGTDAWMVNESRLPVDGEKYVPSFSPANNCQVLGVVDGSLAWVTPESGITSYNDLEDKPFYEETVSVAINYTNPYIDGANADKVVEASYFNTPVPISLYRVGDALTAAQLDGATMDLIYNDGTSEGTDSITLTSANITSVQNGRYYMSEGMPYFVVADVDNTTIEIPNCCQFTSLDAGTYLEYIDMGNFLAGAYCIIPSITKDGVTVIHKLDEKFYNGGVSSWNDLSDRPFYETVTAAGYNFEIDLDDPNYVSGYFDIGEEVPAKFYRVGDPLTAVQLENAIGSFNNGKETETHVIRSSYIEEITDNGDTVGLFVADDFPYCLVINNDNTTIDVDATNDRPFGCSGTFTQAGTYLSWVDLSTMEEGAAGYNPSLVKADVKTVTPLPDKYYKVPFLVTADLDLANLSVSNVSNSFDEIYAAITSGRVVSLTLQFNDGYHDIAIPMLPSQVASNDGDGVEITFAVTAPFAFGGSTNVYTLRVSIASNDTVSSNFYLHDATAQ